jgi:hypothetical protein
MKKFAVFVFADNETKEGLGRVVNAMEVVKELAEANHDVKLFFDGYGTAWPAKLANKDHLAHGLYESVRRNIDGACLFCATAFDTKVGVQKCGLKLVDEYDQHISIANLVSDDYQIINF